MTVQEYIATQTERIAESLCHFLATTDPAKLDWKPTIEGPATTRSIYEQMSECIATNRRFMALLQEEPAANLPADLPESEFTDVTDVQNQLRTSANALAAVIRALPDAALTQIYSHPRAQIVGANLIIMCYRNMTYHAGQINFIQTLYGDTEFHIPANWR